MFAMSVEVRMRVYVFAVSGGSEDEGVSLLCQAEVRMGCVGLHCG